jgi:hypothetical protein
MTTYIITNDKDAEKHIKVLDNFQNARDWVINHLDISKNWTINIEYFDCVSCGHERNLKPNILCSDCSYSQKKFNVYSKLGLEDRLY